MDRGEKARRLGAHCELEGRSEHWGHGVVGPGGGEMLALGGRVRTGLRAFCG